jgi:hypothetical protein
MEMPWISPRSMALVGAMTIGLVCNVGCLSIGGKTYTTQQDPRIEQRVTALEMRVGALEQAATGFPAQATMPPEMTEQF